MSWKRKERPMPEIDLAAFSDVAFLLIIFFILTTTLETSTGTRMEIPAGVERQDEEQAERLTVNVALDAIYYGESAEQLTLEQLRDRLAQEAFTTRPEEERVVLVDVRNDVPYDRYFKVVHAVAEAGGVLGLVERK